MTTPENDQVGTSEVIEGVPTSRSLFDLLIDYANGQYQPEVDELDAWVADGYIFDQRGYFTEKGLDTLVEQNVPLKELYILILGQDIYHFQKGQKLKIGKGSQLMVVYGRYDRRRHAYYWDCYVGDNLPLLRVYQHSDHKFETHRWPVFLPIRGDQFLLTS